MLTASSSLSRSQIVFYTGLALLAFAANSVLCRLALSSEQPTSLIDPSSFTAIRLVSGAMVLWLIMRLKPTLPLISDPASTILTEEADSSNSIHKSTVHRNNTNKVSYGSMLASGLLFAYAIAFSYAYVLLDTATGALILFAAVQISMMVISFIQGQRQTRYELVGALLAFIGFGYLVLPGVNTPSITGLVLMIISGCAWGGYTLLGKQSTAPLFDTGYNFIRTLPLVALMMLSIWCASFFNLFEQHAEFIISPLGVTYAVASGAAASGVGYALWYQALGGLTNSQAAVLQLTVPLIAALGGVLFLNEALSLHLGISAAIILSGILIVIFAKSSKKSLNS